MEAERPLEKTFERIRQKEFPDRPSRLNWIFLCPSLESIKFFISSTWRKQDLIYEVELVDSNATTFETDWTLVNAKILDTEEKREAAARKYWNPISVEEKRKEILADSAVRILRHIS